MGKHNTIINKMNGSVPFRRAGPAVSHASSLVWFTRTLNGSEPPFSLLVGPVLFLLMFIMIISICMM